MLLLMLASRHDVFDAWDWPISLALAFVALAAASVAAGTTLRAPAERARARILERMVERLASMPKGFERQRYAGLVDEVRAERRGAFASWSGNPVLRAVLIPFGGLGGITLVELLAR